jgi:hypothetical protein
MGSKMRRLVDGAKGQFNLNTLLIAAMSAMLENGIRKLQHNNELITDQANSLAYLSLRVEKIERVVFPAAAVIIRPR